jgi:hypothetical protein
MNWHHETVPINRTKFYLAVRIKHSRHGAFLLEGVMLDKLVTSHDSVARRVFFKGIIVPSGILFNYAFYLTVLVLYQRIL